MKRIALALAALGLSTTAAAQVTITEAWARGTVPQQRASGAFMQITAQEDVRLTGGSTPVAGSVQVHDMVMQDNVMRMRHMNEGLRIAAGQTVQLKPGSYHIMFMDLRQQLKGGDTVALTLEFEAAADHGVFQRTIDVPVVALGSANPMMQHHGRHEGHDAPRDAHSHDHGAQPRP